MHCKGCGQEMVQKSPEDVTCSDVCELAYFGMEQSSVPRCFLCGGLHPKYKAEVHASGRSAVVYPPCRPAGVTVVWDTLTMDWKAA